MFPISKKVTVVVIFWLVLAGANVPEYLLIEGPPPVRLPKSAELMVDMELNANPAADRDSRSQKNKRDARPFWIEHFEIPLSALDRDIGLGLEKAILDSMVFHKNGQQYVRWILNPEDTVYSHQLGHALEAQGLSATRHRHYIGYLTASRSCIVQDSKSGITFSIKGSTNHTAGFWKNKKETIDAARAGRMLSDFLTEHIDPTELEALRIIKEPLAFYFKGLDQAIIIRQYDHFLDNNKDKLLIPAFSAGHVSWGVTISELNGSKSPGHFWKTHLMGPLGTAMAELVMLAGLVYN